MNTKIPNARRAQSLVAAAVATALLAACASAPTMSPAAAEVRGRLTALKSDPNLANRAPAAIEQAEMAVREAEMKQNDKALTAHRVYIADRKVETARALAQTSFAEVEQTKLTAERERARLDARTREADAARERTRIAQSQEAQQKLAADQARSEAGASQADAENARRIAADLQRQLDEMNAQVTDRGVVLTLGDTLFTSGRADLKAGTTANLDKLATFLGQYPDRVVVLEGHTDSLGSDESNRMLSERRAESVKSYLVGRGVGGNRLTALGKGEGSPVADNDSAAGRLQNRRVEVIINNPAVVSR